MKKIIVICLILVLNNEFSTGHFLRFLRHNPPPPPMDKTRSFHVSKNYFTQKLDHFNSEDNTTWSQKYYVNTKLSNNSTNNVFLMLGGEGEAYESWMVHGSWAISAKKYGALMFQLEHRFYGESVPFPDLATENLRYLSSQQALADAANFIRSMNKIYSLPPDVKWIVFGGSYSGSLAAWMRLKYPELVHGAVSSSAPLLAKLDFPEYFRLVIDDLAITNKDCVSSLKAATNQVDELLSNPSPHENLTSIFNLCEPIEELDSNDLSIGNFFNRLATPFAGAAQYEGLKLVCSIMSDTSTKEIYRLAKIMRWMDSYDCLDYSYHNDVEYLRDINNVHDEERQWIYQTCTEYGWYQTTDSEDRVFGRGTSVKIYTSLCEDVFGPEFNTTFINNQIDRTNSDYGATNINVSKVVYVHGSLDPWHTVSLLETTNLESPVIFIEGTSHCADMYGPRMGEVQQLTAAREEVVRIIGSWLGSK